MDFYLWEYLFHKGAASSARRGGWGKRWPFRRPWSLVAETWAQTAFPPTAMGAQRLKKNFAFEKSFPWWRWRELNPRPKRIHLPIVHKISRLYTSMQSADR